MTKQPFYLTKRGSYWYVRHRDPKTGEILTAHSLSVKNRARAEDLAREEAIALFEKSFNPPKPFREWAAPFFEPSGCPHTTRLRTEGRPYSEHTRIHNLSILRNHILYDPIADMNIQDIRRADVLEFRERLIQKLGLRRIVQSTLQTLRVILREALFREIIDRDPCLGLGPVAYKKKTRKSLTRDELLRLLEPSLYERIEHYHATLIAALTGMRAGEVRALQWQDLEPSSGIIYIRRALGADSSEVHAPKWGKQRITAYPSTLQTILEPLRGDKTAYVLSCDGGPIGYKRWAQAFARASKKADVLASLHSLRHTLNTLLRSEGIRAETLKGSFGWSSDAVADGYTHRELYEYNEQAEAIDILFHPKNAKKKTGPRKNKHN